MVKINGSQMMGRGTLGLVAALLELKGESSNWASSGNREQIVQDALRHEMVLQSLYDEGGTLCILGTDGRVTPLQLGDVTQHSYQNMWGRWMAEGHFYPDAPTIRIVQHAVPERGFYCIFYELHQFGSSVYTSRFEDALYNAILDVPQVDNMAYCHDCALVISRDGLSPEEGSRLVEDCLKEIQAILVLEPDNHHDVVRVDATDFANPDEAIGFIEPDWSADDLVDAVLNERV